MSRNPSRGLKKHFAAALAALPLMGAMAAESPAVSSDIPVPARPATYAAEKQAHQNYLKDEAPLKSTFFRDASVRQMFPETQCTTFNGATGGVKVKEALRTLKEIDTLTGPLIGHYMAANEAWYCERKLSNIKGNLWGLTYDYYGIVAINETKPMYRLLGVTAHETLHLMQKARGLSEIDAAGDIYSLQSRFLANEAAAHAMEVAYAFELAQAGDMRAWDGLATPLIYADGRKNPSPYLGLQAAFAAGYAQAVKLGATHAEALKAGGRDTVTAFVTTEQAKLDIYNEIVLQVYISRIGTELTGPGKATWTDEKTMLAGKVTDHFSLTEGFTLPAPELRFGKNDGMRWAFEAADLYRKKLGDAPDYAELRAKAAAGGNPYLDVDFKAALEKMPGAILAASPVRTVSVLDQLSGRAPVKPPAPKVQR
ncbi:MAG: DUF6782 family putative metallopeptidase [Alphaproteobacteria bacterium]